MKTYTFLLGWLLLSISILAQPNNKIRGIITYQSSGAKPIKGVSITAFGAGTVYSLDAGNFELSFSNGKPGNKVTLVVQKEGHQVLGFNPMVVEWNIPTNVNDLLQIAMVKTSDYESKISDFERGIEKSIAAQNKNIEKLRIDLETKALTDAEREALTDQITKLYQEVQQLTTNKEELAKRLAQTDLDQASQFAQEALRKFKENGDVQAALQLMSEEKLQAFSKNVEEQEEKLQRAKAQDVENYMVRARMLIADFQFPAAYKSYQTAIAKDSTNLDNLREIALFMQKQRQDSLAHYYYQLCLRYAKTDIQKSAFLNNLGNLLKDNQKMGEAETHYSEALQIRRQLATKNPDAFLPDVAMTLNNLGVLYYANQQMKEAQIHYTEALQIYRILAAKNPDAFLPDVATILNNLGEYYRVNQRMVKAEAHFSEALQIRRQLAAKNPDAFLPNVAVTLNNLGEYYRVNQRMVEAEAHYREALQIRRQLAAKNPDAFLPYVATTLNNLGLFYYDNQRMGEAETHYSEALQIRRQLAAKNSDAFLPDVAHILNNLGLFYYDNQRMKEAQIHYTEALQIYRILAAKNPNAFLPYVANTLNNYGAFYQDNQRMAEAETHYSEALQIRRQLAAKNPRAFNLDVCSTALNICFFYKGTLATSADEKYRTKALELLEEVSQRLSIFPKSIPTVQQYWDRHDVLKAYFEKIQRLEQQVNDATDPAERVRYQEEIVQLLQPLVDNAPDNQALKVNFSDKYGSLAWYYLFTTQFQEAEQAARQGIALGGEAAQWIHTNLALALLYQGKYQEAEVIYQQFKGKAYDEERSWTEVFLADLDELEKAGITHPDVAKVRKLLRE